jgi:outer membrane biosynthesis protein TonB
VASTEEKVCVRARRRRHLATVCVLATVMAVGFLATQAFGGNNTTGSSARPAATTVPSPDPPPAKSKPVVKPKPRYVPRRVVTPPPPPPSPPPTPPSAAVVPPPPPAPVHAKTARPKRHRAQHPRRAHGSRVHPTRQRRFVGAAATRTVENAAAVVPLVPQKQPSRNSGLVAVVVALLVVSFLLLLAAALPLQLLPDRLAFALAERRPDLATAGAIGLIAFVLAYVISHA